MQDKHPYFYYQPNQIGMRVSNKGDQPDPKVIANAWKFVNDEARKGFDYIGKPNDAFIPSEPPRQYSFTDETEQGKVTTTYAFRGEIDVNVEIFARKLLPALVEQINNSDFVRKQENGLDWVDLNWLGCGGNGISPGDGGPGGPPHPFPPDSDPLPVRVPYDFEGQLIAEVRRQKHPGEDITVVILDTAPSTNALTAAYDKWVTNADPGHKHPILERLWTANGVNPRLKIEPMKTETKDRLKLYSMEEHQYSISDHGLFIAGIIDTIAPDADLRLYEALNERGVCDSESVLAGLEWIQNTLKPKRVVVNCSLFLLMPYHEKHFRKDVEERFPDTLPWNDAAAFRIWLEKQAKFCQSAFDLFHTGNRVVVACAGNDWHHGNPQDDERPPARYPAAHDTVFGVGAQEIVDPPKNKHTPARYSNHDDKPESLGVSAFGGGLGDGKGTDPAGMIGVYISDSFPPEKGSKKDRPNEHGWARWAGTSFATPVVSGLVAAIMSDSSAPQGTDDAANKIKSAPYSTIVNNENMLNITQG